MNKILATALGLAAFTAAYGQGTVLIQNNLGAAITYILTDAGAQAKGANYSVEVFKYDAGAAGGFGAQLGSTVTIGANGRFTAGQVSVPDAAGGTTAQLIVRAWDNTTGGSYAAALIKGSSTPFTTGVLGGAGNPPATPSSMVTGLASGFQSFALTPEPTTIALGALGAKERFGLGLTHKNQAHVVAAWERGVGAQQAILVLNKC